jgi:mono/diheme cytochrome c family protein
MRVDRSGRTGPGARAVRLGALAALLGTAAIAWSRTDASEGVRQQAIPRVWNEEALEEFSLPLPNTDVKVEHISPEYYYALRERVIHRTYPIYHPDFEPPGYLDSLRTLAPGSALDTDTLKSDAEWIRAGELVFDAPQVFRPVDGPLGTAALAAAGTPVAADGTFPFQRYVVLPGGKVMVGILACGNCHTRVMDDGSVVKGAQTNFPVNLLISRIARALPPNLPKPLPRPNEQFRAPWIDHPSQTMLDTIGIQRLADHFAAIPAGVHTRQGTNPLYPAMVPDLRGFREMRFFDASGVNQQRSIGDLMRYAALNQFIDLLNRYGDFVPSLGHHPGPLPPPDSVESRVNGPFTRLTDPQLYALARYIYSLEPLPSPHEYDDETLALGERVFVAEGCVTCHPPPLYTNNELTPALGFEPPEDHYERFPIFDVSVETDPGLTLYTRRGTGYYKIPSLRGLWYRERLFHDGSLSLEEVLDPARLNGDFVPSGFRGADSPTKAIPGHPFGFDLSEREKAALIAYLNTL